MWLWRRMEKIKCSEKITDEQVLERIHFKIIFYIGKSIGLILFLIRN